LPRCRSIAQDAILRLKKWWLLPKSLVSHTAQSTALIIAGVHESLLQECEKDIIWYRDNFFGRGATIRAPDGAHGSLAHQNFLAAETPSASGRYIVSFPSSTSARFITDALKVGAAAAAGSSARPAALHLLLLLRCC
jgi:hypothetical protein